MDVGVEMGFRGCSNGSYAVFWDYMTVIELV